MPVTEYSNPDERRPQIEAVPCTERTCSCQACGAANYRRVPEKGFAFESVDLPLVELRLCANGHQTDVSRICYTCCQKIAIALLLAVQ